uniref:Proteasome assembly chaperone 4 n=1 Tax=Anthurium amnicola TaxID=1678845 RepID=A0A1D1Y1Z8_9ARAE
MLTEAATPRFEVHTYSHLFLSQQIHFQLTILQDSVFIWVGSEGNEILGNLAIAMPSPLRNNSPTPSSGTTVLANDVDETSKQLGQRLATKFNKQFIVSINLPPSTDQMVLSFAEKKVLAIVKEFFS